MAEAPKFNIPPEPQPVPVVFSDDESFVVLGSSEFDALSLENAGRSIIEDAKQLLQEELCELSLALNPKTSATLQPEQTQCEAVTNNNADASASADRSVLTLSQVQFDPLVASQPQFDEMTPAISIFHLPANEFASEEIQKKVAQIIDENIELKNTLVKNNESMREHLKKVATWKEAVEQAHTNNKEKLTHCFNNLRQENTALKLQLDEANRTIQEQHSAKAAMDDEHAISLKANKMLEAKLLEFESELENSYKINKELQMQVEQCGSPSFKLYQDRTQKEISFLQLELAKNLQYSEANTKLAQELDYSRAAVLKLEEEMKMREQQAKIDRAELENKLVQVIDERNSLRDHITCDGRDIQKSQDAETKNELTKHLKETQDLVGVLQTTLQRASLTHETDLVSNLQRQICQKDHELATINNSVQLHNTKLSAALQENTKLKASLEEVTQKLAAQKEMLQQHEMERFELCQRAQNQDPTLPQQLLQAKHNLEEQTGKLRLAEENIRMLQSNIQDLNDKLKELTETEVVLRSQLEVYRSDFDAEKNAKEEALGEKTKIAEDLHHLHRRNQQLQEELEACRLRSGFTYVGPANRNSPSSSNTKSYVCPKCKRPFNNIRDCEVHVEECLSLL